MPKHWIDSNWNGDTIKRYKYTTKSYRLSRTYKSLSFSELICTKYVCELINTKQKLADSRG